MSGITMTCLTCNVAFGDVEMGRIHYKTDWHRYNLKRKVANLTPVTLEQFQERQKLQEQLMTTAEEPTETLFCKPCNKSFGSSNSYDNHMQSKKHKDMVAYSNKKSKGKKKQSNKSAGTVLNKADKPQNNVDQEEEEMATDDDDDVESWDSYDENCLGMEECFFCSFASPTLEENLKHMTAEHSFFIPDAEYVCDLEGLISYLGEKVGAGRVCLWCNEKGKTFHSTKDVQRHMVDKGHCKILHEGETLLEFEDFYDYRSSYPDALSGDKALEDVSASDLDSDGFSLTLPSGATIGHRSLVRYYHQNMVPYTRERTAKVLPKMLAHYKALGWTGSTGPQVALRARDLKFVQNIRKKHFMQAGVKANNLRHRFRSQNPI